MSDATVKFMLGEQDIPTHWVNLMPDLPGEPAPPLHPDTKQPAGPDDLTPLFPMGLILQEVSAEPEIEIPEQVREVAVRDPGDERPETNRVGHPGEVRERRVAVEHVFPLAAHLRDLDEVVHHVEAREADLLSGLRDLRERPRTGARVARPVEPRYLQAELE